MKTIILILGLIISLQAISQTTPKRIKDLTDTQASYDENAYLVTDKTGYTTAKKIKIGTIVPEFYKLEIGTWQMNSTLYKEVTVSADILDRVIAIVAISIIDDGAERDIHAGFGVYDGIFYSNLFGGIAEAQTNTVSNDTHRHTEILNANGSGVGIQLSIPTGTINSNTLGTNEDTHNHVVTNNQSAISSGFFGKTISIRAHTDKANGRIRLMHNNTQVGNGQETAEGNASIASQGQMANFSNPYNNRGYILLMLTPAP